MALQSCFDSMVTTIIILLAVLITFGVELMLLFWYLPLLNPYVALVVVLVMVAQTFVLYRCVSPKEQSSPNRSYYRMTTSVDDDVV